MRNYANAIAKELEAMGYETEVKDIDKANGIVLTGVVVKKPGDIVGVTVYVKDMFDKGFSVEEAAEKAKELFENSIEAGKEYGDVVELLKNYENVKDKLTVRLYNEKTVAEVKRSAKRYGFDDLIMVPVVNLSIDKNGSGSIKVKEDMISMWDVTKDQVFRDAIANTKKDVKAKSMFETLAEMQGIGIDELKEILGEVPADMEHIVVSNGSNICGASAILGELPLLKKRFKNGFYVLPSSIHEVIVVPNDGKMDNEALGRMVREVNATTVDEQEILGHKAYSFV
jgi:hypothetical protein